MRRTVGTVGAGAALYFAGDSNRTPILGPERS